MLDLFLRSYRNLNAIDPPTWIADKCELLSHYPEWCGQAALDKAKDIHVFPPERAELKAILEDYFAVFRTAAVYNAEAKKLIAERLALPPPAVPQILPKPVIASQSRETAAPIGGHAKRVMDEIAGRRTG